jgi:hypothetical protein
MMGLYLLALLFGYLGGVATVFFYQWLMRQLGHGPYLEVWKPRSEDTQPLVTYDEDGRTWIEGEEYAPSITWMGSVPPGTTARVDEVKRDEE